MKFDLEWLVRTMNTPRENPHLEFKKAKSSYSYDNLLEYCVALANEGGGQLILGVTDKHPRKVEGSSAFKQPDVVSEKVFAKLGIRVSIHICMHPDGRVLVVDIPSRPKGRPMHVDGKYLMRVGEQLHPMSPEQLTKIIEEGKDDFLDEVAIKETSGTEVVRLLDTQFLFQRLKLPYPMTRDGVLQRLTSEGLILKREDRFSIKNIGAILFAKSLSRFPSLADKAPRVVVYDGVNKLKSRLDQVGGMGYACGFQRLVEYVLAQVPSNEVIEKAIRKSVTMFPPIAIRELIANALIHQDFSISGSRVMVELYDDRIEITNPGIPSISTDRFIDEYRSRNTKVADIMRRLGICEEQGSGIDKVIDSAEFWQLPAPDFSTSEYRTIAKLFAHRDFKKMTKQEKVRACYQHCCLRHVSNQIMNNTSLRDRFGLPKERAERVSIVIRETIKANLIKSADPTDSSKKHAKYVPFWA